ncbi:TetR/AcrR family transcriptional regulator [Rhodococcus sp. PvR099]|jgi:TetR/AcrR family transcriptional regulator, transcriptional repressor for nem operon|uniref:TetR/AcrR family transcriptional regulator n=1 Tax=Rhodococcus sp. PvR099 TaxID=2806602 RepID=UPI001AE3FB4D|nr:TetR/AcrR family transcriptional regulator [Rhodococcus sp. PvR099]MBP1161553.1 AcrR family transcriptional regulator [Rhodococcus sp. PvR099]
MSAADRLVESMQTLLWERGYTATSPRAVQELAEAGQGSMYHHFSGKAALAVTAEHRMCEELRDQILGRLESGATAREKIAAFLTVDENVLRGCRLGRLVQDAAVVNDEHLREPIATMFEWIQIQIRDVLNEGVSSGDLPAELDIETLAATILAVRQGAYVLARGAQSAEPFRRATEGILQLLPVSQREATRIR